MQVRGKIVRFIAKAKDKHYGLPNFLHDEYSALLESYLDYNNILAELRPLGAQWVHPPHTSLPLTILHSYLIMIAKMVNIFTCGNLMPSKNKKIVHKKRVLLLYSICKDYTIDVRRLNRSSILDIALGAKTERRGHSAVITALCVAVKVFIATN